MHFKCINFNSRTRVIVYAERIYVFFNQNLVIVTEFMLIVDNHCSDVCCDEFPVPQIDR